MAKKDKVRTNVAVYIGPDIKGKVKNGTAFKNGLSDVLINEIKSQPLIEKLIVSVDELASSVNEVKTEGTVLNIVYKTALGGMK